MKYINKILSLFVIALIATSCDPDAESYTPGELEDGNQGICFVGNYTQTVEVEPGITSFDLTLTRSLTDAAGTVDVTVINNEENPLAELNKRIFKSANRFVVNVVYILKDCKCTYFP